MSIPGSWRCVLLLVSHLALAAPAFAAIHHPGKWTSPILWRQGSTAADYFKETAVNLALLALPDSAGQPQARVLWWQDDHELLHVPEDRRTYGGFWDWRPGSDLGMNGGVFPDTTAGTGTLRARRFPTPGYNIFCTGMAQMSEEDDGFGRLLLGGGTTEAENGSTEARIYSARTNSWLASGNELAVGRWYPTLTTLPQGALGPSSPDFATLVLSGSRFKELRLLGGHDTDNLMHRRPVSHEVATLPSVLPDEAGIATPPKRMGPLRGLSASGPASGWLYCYGGISPSSGLPQDHFWQLGRGENASGADYTFGWERREGVPVFDDNDLPKKRAYHAAAIVPAAQSPMGSDADALLVVGGQTYTDATQQWAVDGSVFLGRFGPSGWTFIWQQLELAPGSVPLPARFGHASFWNEALDCLFVYGGTSTLGGLPSDPDVYSLQLIDNGDDDQVLVTRCTLQDPTGPYARGNFASGTVRRKIQPDPQDPASKLETTGMLVYGGRTSQDVVSDSLWVLWPLDATTVRWQQVAQSAAAGGSVPPPLEFAAGTGTTNTGELWLSGGLAGGQAQDEVYSFHLECPEVFSDHVCPTGELEVEWEVRGTLPHAAWGHAQSMDSNEHFARTHEVYDPGSNQFTHYAGLSRLLDWYPHAFVVPGSGGTKVVTTSPSDETWMFEPSLSGPAWTQVTSATSTDFSGGSAVMYRPGKIMKCGSRDTDGVGGSSIATTMTLDITSLAGGGSPAWQGSDDMAVGRVNHNLVLLPDGRTLAAGGMGERRNDKNNDPRRRPELWEPNGNGGAGSWEGADGAGIQLDESDVVRGYHSTALLLPDARVLCAGGNATNHAGQPYPDDQYRTDIYSPPYLFNADGTTATRPSLLTAPRRVNYGEEFAVSTGGSAADAVVSACLIRAGATTHGYDAAQLYIPLTFAQVGPYDLGRRFYQAVAPGDPAVAPPGDYLLFVLNGQGTPSIARWVRVSHAAADVTIPTTITDLGRECLDGLAVRLRWSPPACLTPNGASVQVSAATQYDIRWSTNRIHDLASFNGATAITPSPSPGAPYSDPDRVDTQAFTAGQTVHFRMRSRNAAGAWSELSNEFVWQIQNQDCGGSGGGGGGGGSEYEVSIRPGAGRFSAGFRRPGPANADTTYLENTLLVNAPPDVAGRDLLRLPFGPRWTSGGARVRLSREGREATHFGSVRLLAVDGVAGEGVFVRGGEPVAGITHDPARVTHADGRDLTEIFLFGGGFDGQLGDTLYVDFGADGPGSFALSTRRAQLVRAPSRTGIELACEGSGGWSNVGRHEVRERSSDEVFDAPELRRVRLAFQGGHRLEGLVRFTPGAPVAVTAFGPASVEHSRHGAVGDRFARGDGATLEPGDHLFADFTASQPAEGAVRKWFLEVTGTHVTASGGAQGATLAGGAEASPAVFALARGRPNPFVDRTSIEFDVPRRARVRIEVFDVLGRRVASLADREYLPGRFALEWDGRTSAGTSARAGVYLCRMVAGGFTSEQRIVLLR